MLHRLGSGPDGFERGLNLPLQSRFSEWDVCSRVGSRIAWARNEGALVSHRTHGSPVTYLVAGKENIMYELNIKEMSAWIYLGGV